MRFLLFFFICLSLFSLSGYAENGDSETCPTSIPDPIELQKDWWCYFKVSNGELSEKIDKFLENLDKNLSFLTEENHREMIHLKEDISLKFRNLEKNVNQLVPSEPPPLKMLKKYTIEQLLEVNQKLMHTRNEISKLEDKIDFLKLRMGRHQSKLDKQILQYYQLPKASYERLLSGLTIIEMRVDGAIYQSELDALFTLISYNRKTRSLLSEELKNAKDKMDYSTLDRQNLVRDFENNKLAIEKAQQRLEDLEEEDFKQNNEELKSQILCCLLNYKIITETIRIENLNVKKLIDEVKIKLSDISQNGNGLETDQIKSSLLNWEKTISSSKQVMFQWQKQLENDHAQVSKMIIEKLNKESEMSDDTEEKIADIHLEIDHSFAILEEMQNNITGAEHLINLVQNRFVQEKSLSESWNFRLTTYWQKLLVDIDELNSITLFYVKEHPVTIRVVLKAILTIISALFLSWFIRNTLSKRIFVSKRFSKSTKYITFRVIHYVLLILAFLLALSFIGIDLTNIAIIAGALGVGIGFGLQSVVNNIISGFTLLFNRYLKVGDIIELQEGIFATVSEISLQFTHICTFDGADRVIPNSELSTSGLTNWTMHNTYRRYRVPFGVAYGTDKENLQKVILESVKEQPYVVTGSFQFPDPQIWFIEYGDYSMEFELVAWVNLMMKTPHGIASSSLLWLIDDVFSREGIKVPFPQQDLYIKEFANKNNYQ